LPKIELEFLLSKVVVFKALFQLIPVIKKVEMRIKINRMIEIIFFIYTPPAMLKYRIYYLDF
jgi:hypothetical protein